MEALDWPAMALLAIGGLALFLYGVGKLSRALHRLADDRLKSLLRQATDNRFAGLATGAGATIVLDSSSATIIMLIAMIDAGLLSSAQGLAVILGSNIGTTASSQILATGIADYAPLILAAGLLGRLLKNERAHAWSNVVFGVGLVLFGLFLVGEAAAPLRDEPSLIERLRRLEKPIYGMLAGAAVTVVLQSSSAVIGIVIVLAAMGVVSLPAGIAIMLGAEIGTCADTLLAAIGRSRAAIRAAIFHLGFSIISSVLGLLFIHYITSLATASADSVPQQIANAHVAFNVAGALLFLPFLPAISRLLERILPDRAKR
ncbi:MAG: Na/Pi symporter [Sphingomicrobium sp.]